MSLRKLKIGPLLLAFTFLTPGFFAQSAERLFQAALYQEEAEGELDSAIEMYQEILKQFPDQRLISAKAQLHIGLCFEKLGHERAREAYDAVVRDFADQPDIVAEARNRLAEIDRAVSSRGGNPSFRKIQIPGRPDNGVFSPDGRELAFFADGGLWIVPVRGNVSPDIAGEPTRIADVPGGWGSGNLLSWAANGEWIAVNGEFAGEDTVYVVPTSGGEPKLVPLPPRGGHSWSYRVSLSPAGEQLAFSALELGLHEQQTTVDRYIYTVPTDGGAPQRLTFNWSRLPAYSQDGKYIAYVGYREREDWSEDSKRSRFHGDLWIVPAAGGTPVRLETAEGRLRGPVWSPDGRWIAVHNEPGPGNVSREIWLVPASPDVSSQGDPIKIALPRMSVRMLAGWTPQDELGLFMETEQHGALYTVTSSGGKAVQVSPQGIVWYPRWSRDGERIYHRLVVSPQDDGHPEWLFHVPSTGGAAVGVPVHSERRLVSMIPGGGLDISPDGQMIVVTAGQQPYKQEEGVDMWAVPLSSGPPMRLTHDPTVESHPCWSPDGRWIAFTRESPEGDSGAIYMMPSEGGEARPITSPGDDVGPGAIAFSPDGKRIAFFSDQTIKAMPVQGGTPEVLVREIKHGRHSELAFSPSGDRIAFTTGRPYDGEAKVWVAQLDTGSSTELQTGLPADAMYHGFSWSPDGEKIAFVAYTGGKNEFWLMEDFLPLVKTGR